MARWMESILGTLVFFISLEATETLPVGLEMLVRAYVAVIKAKDD